MRHKNHTVFDEFVPNVNVVLTSAELNAQLGHSDQIAIQVVVDNIDAKGGAFDLYIEHSADGRNFSRWSTGSADVHLANLQMTSLNTGYGSVPSATLSTPLLAYVRFSMNLSGSTTKGHVHVSVTHRDQGG